MPDWPKAVFRGCCEYTTQTADRLGNIVAYVNALSYDSSPPQGMQPRVGVKADCVEGTSRQRQNTHYCSTISSGRRSYMTALVWTRLLWNVRTKGPSHAEKAGEKEGGSERKVRSGTHLLSTDLRLMKNEASPLSLAGDCSSSFFS